jgi:hypothetical protein
MILSVYFLNSLNISNFVSRVSPTLLPSVSFGVYANLLNFSIKLMNILLISTSVFKLAVVSKSCSSEAR